MFDVSLEQRMTRRFAVERPDLETPWSIGLIVGASGSGKSTVARRLFGESLYDNFPWPNDKAVIDAAGDLPVKQLTGLFTAVGFSSPPSWVKPYRVLSNGEQFRCDLVRALASAWIGKPSHHAAPPIIAFDEFTSVVDRNVAKIGSAAIAKQIRGGRIPCRFVAVTCHYDVADWLAPDWIIDMSTGHFTRRRLRRPDIELEIVRCRREAWDLFAPHHYLTGSLAKAARCFLATWNGEPVAFCASVSVIGYKGRWRIGRLVTLPDFQGLGIGVAMAEAVCELHKEEGHRIGVTASHPAVIAHCRRSTRWRTSRVMKNGSRGAKDFIQGYRSSSGRAVVSFEFTG